MIVQQKRVLSGEEAECLLQLGLSVERQLLLQGGGVCECRGGDGTVTQRTSVKQVSFEIPRGWQGPDFDHGVAFCFLITNFDFAWCFLQSQIQV